LTEMSGSGRLVVFHHHRLEGAMNDPHINFGRSLADLVPHTVCCPKCCTAVRDFDHRDCPCECHNV
jgi:hypothetical protein